MMRFLRVFAIGALVSVGLLVAFVLLVSGSELQPMEDVPAA